MQIVLTTLATEDSGRELAGRIVGQRLAACVQILPRMRSIYVWEGELMEESEHLLLIKTLPEKWDELQSLITANHPYDVPEIVAIDSSQVSESYQEWLTAAVGDTE